MIDATDPGICVFDGCQIEFWLRTGRPGHASDSLTRYCERKPAHEVESRSAVRSAASARIQQERKRPIRPDATRVDLLFEWGVAARHCGMLPHSVHCAQEVIRRSPNEGMNALVRMRRSDDVFLGRELQVSEASRFARRRCVVERQAARAVR